VPRTKIVTRIGSDEKMGTFGIGRLRLLSLRHIVPPPCEFSRSATRRAFGRSYQPEKNRRFIPFTYGEANSFAIAIESQREFPGKVLSCHLDRGYSV
jgi:hypothetical protein